MDENPYQPPSIPGDGKPVDKNGDAHGRSSSDWLILGLVAVVTLAVLAQMLAPTVY